VDRRFRSSPVPTSLGSIQLKGQVPSSDPAERRPVRRASPVWAGRTGRRVGRALGLTLVAALGSLLGGIPAAFAAPKDAAATKLADDAINRDYLAANFPEAEKKLRSALTMCGSNACIPVVVGRLHRDLGVVLIAGMNRLEDGKQELAEAIRADPDVALEKDLTTPEIEREFKALKVGGLPPPKPTTGGGGGELVHTPPPEQRTLTAVPIYVELPEGAAANKVIARYKPFGTPDWKTLELIKLGNGYGAEVPCMDVGSSSGEFLYYVQATDAGGEVIGTSGTRQAPNKVVIQNAPVSEPPHLPGRPPPNRCREAGDCTPGAPGCGKRIAKGRGWGATCVADPDCGRDFWCKAGACEAGVRPDDADAEPQASGRYCDTSTDCESGERCTAARVCERAPEKAKKVWLSLNIGQDASFIGTQADVCGNADTLTANQYSCMQPGDSSYEGIPVESAPGTGNAINGGLNVATTRILAGLEALVGSNVTLGARLGYAFRTDSRSSLAKFHGEARVSFWFGREPFSRRTVRPYLVIAGGLAEVGDKFSVPVIESDPTQSTYPTETLTVWRKSGPDFGGGGVGMMIPTGGAGQGVTAEIKVVALFPDASVAMSPTIGYSLGL
jgi:hypothetical protein